MTGRASDTDELGLHRRGPGRGLSSQVLGFGGLRLKSQHQGPLGGEGVSGSLALSLPASEPAPGEEVHSTHGTQPGCPGFSGGGGGGGALRWRQQLAQRGRPSPTPGGALPRLGAA